MASRMQAIDGKFNMSTDKGTKIIFEVNFAQTGD